MQQIGTCCACDTRECLVAEGEGFSYAELQGPIRSATYGVMRPESKGLADFSLIGSYPFISVGLKLASPKVLQSVTGNGYQAPFCEINGKAPSLICR